MRVSGCLVVVRLYKGVRHGVEHRNAEAAAGQQATGRGPRHARNLVGDSGLEMHWVDHRLAPRLWRGVGLMISQFFELCRAWEVEGEAAADGVVEAVDIPDNKIVLY